MKKATVLMCLLGTCVIGFSQQNRSGQPIGGIIVKGGSMLVNLSGGLSSPASGTKENSFLGSGKNVNAGIYAPFYSFGPNDNFTLGANINGSYSKFDGDVNASPKYNIKGQSAAPTGAKTGNGNATAYTAEAGLRANFSFGKITFSPILNAGYFSFKQDGFKLTQSNQVNGQTYNFNLYNQAEIKGKGFAFIPKFRIGYFPGKLGLHLETSYLLGPEITSSKTTLQPLGAADVEGNYQLDQLMAGKQIISESTTAFKSVGFNFGITYALGNARKKANASNAGDKPQNQSIINTTKSNTKDKVTSDSVFTGGTNPTGQPQNQSIVNTSKSNTKDRVVNDSVFTGGTNPTGQPQNQSIVNTSKSNTKDRVIKDSVFTGGTNPTGQPQNQSIINTSKSNTKDRVANENNVLMQVFYTGSNAELKNMKLSIKGNGEKLPDGTPIVSGKVVTGKLAGNGAEATNIVISQPETGDMGSATTDKEGNFSITLGHDTVHRIFINNVAYGKIKIKETSNVARPGEPIGGIVVKGGRNPGGQMNIISNSNGEITFTNGEAADFKFTIETPETRADNGNAARPGAPIGGVVVKGGKNPGGQMFTTTTNGNGDIEFKNLPAGNYKFTLTAPTEPKQYESFRKGWDGTVKGGSKAESKTTNPLYEGNANTGTNPLANPSNAAKPGGPIGGIVVKGGKNPGGQMNIISNSQGEFTFTNGEAADFKFTIETPETTADNGNAGRPGEPIGGIIVKGGRNPGGQMFTTTTNGNGDIEFKNLPAGNYKFTLTAPTEPKQYESFRKGWDGTVKGGSK